MLPRILEKRPVENKFLLKNTEDIRLTLCPSVEPVS